MKMHAPLDSLLGSPARVRVLRLLLQFPATPFTGREVARLCHLAPSQAWAALEHLRREGILGRTAAGRAYLWQANRTHILSSTLGRLFAEDRSILESLSTAIRRGLRSTRVGRARLYGSVARATEGIDSDVDLYVELDSEKDRSGVDEQLGRLSTTILDRFGNVLTPLVYTKARASRPPNVALLQAIESEGIPVVE